MDRLADECRPKPNYTIGFRLLDKFQHQWQHIHSKSEQNVAKSNEALAKLRHLAHSSSLHLDALDEFTSNYKDLPKINDQLERIDSDLRQLEGNLVKLEELLVVLRDRKEQADLHEHVNRLRASYESQVAERKIASVATKERLKREHLQKVEAYEREQQRELEERRTILEKAFEEEKSKYLANASKNLSQS